VVAVSFYSPFEQILKTLKLKVNKLSNTTSPTRQATHQDADSTNDFPSPPGTKNNGYHFFLMRED
jgi:hypothetical protein